MNNFIINLIENSSEEIIKIFKSNNNDKVIKDQLKYYILNNIISEIQQQTRVNTLHEVQSILGDK